MPIAQTAASSSAGKELSSAKETAPRVAETNTLADPQPVAPAPAPKPNVPAVNPVTASLTDNIANTTKVDKGSTINYTATITNITGATISGVEFQDTPDSNTTLVGGSIMSSAVANDDTYPQTVIGNVSINSANIPYSVVSNDYLGSNPAATITDVSGTTTIVTNTITATSANSGTVVMTVSGADMGKFTYDPPAGFEGTDTFTYTLSDGVTDKGSASSNRTATVSLPVNGMVWFINNNAAGCTVAGCGRLSSPFSTLAAFNALNDNGGGNHPGNNDNIFIYESGTDYFSSTLNGVPLLSGQKLFGQDS